MYTWIKTFKFQIKINFNKFKELIIKVNMDSEFFFSFYVRYTDSWDPV